MIEAAALLAILALGLALRRRYFMGVVGPDNFDYLELANSVRHGSRLFDHDVSLFHVDRLAMTLPLALSLVWFGVGEWSAALWPLLCSLGSVVVALLLGRGQAGPIAGLAAAAYVAVCPLEIVYATTPLPDTVFSLFAGLSAYLFLVGLDRRGRAAALVMAGAGLALGVAYYARVNALFLFVFFALWLLRVRRRPPASLLMLGLGLALVLLLGAAFVVARGGSPLFELEQIPRLSAMNAGMIVSRGGRDPLLHFASILLYQPMFRGWTWLALAAAAGLAIARDRRLALPALLFAVWYVYLELFSQYPAASMVQKEPRYLTPVVLPLALALGIAVARVVSAARGWRRWPAAAALVVGAWPLVAPAVAAGGAFAADQRTLETRAPRLAAAALRDLPRLPVYVTADWLTYLNFYGGFADGLDVADPRSAATATLKMARLDPQSRPLEVGRGLVVHDETYGLEVPASWTLLARAEPATAIYYAPDPTLPDAGLYEPRLGLGVAASPSLTAVAAGTTREPTAGLTSVAIDWTTGVAGPRAQLTLTARAPDAAGAASPASARASLDAGRAWPSELWRPGGVYRVYYELPAAPPDAELLVSVDGQTPVSLGPLERPAIAAAVEPELFDGVKPDQDRALGALAGWGSYSQPPYSGGKAAIARAAGARAEGRLPAPLPPGDRRLFLRVFSYGEAENRVEIVLNGQPATAAWRSGAASLGWVWLDFPANPGGDRLELVAAAIGQPFAIVDRIGVGR